MRHSLAALFFLLGCRNGASPTATPALFLDSVPGKTDLVDYEPAWSPSGTHLAFISNRNGPLKVYTAKVDGTELIQLTRGPEEDDSPSWSPDREADRLRVDPGWQSRDLSDERGWFGPTSSHR